ncbi:MAG: hypothetical protein AB1486_14720 [Planctomycetota bacterium]
MASGNPARIFRPHGDPVAGGTFCVSITGEGPVTYWWEIDGLGGGQGVVASPPATICVPIPPEVVGSVLSIGVHNKSGADGEDWIVRGV